MALKWWIVQVQSIYSIELNDLLNFNLNCILPQNFLGFCGGHIHYTDNNTYCSLFKTAFELTELSELNSSNIVQSGLNLEVENV